MEKLEEKENVKIDIEKNIDKENNKQNNKQDNMEKLKRFCKSIYIPFIVLALMLIVIHIPISKIGDDIWFEDILNNQGIMEFSVSRYNNWTSRSIIEMVLVIFSSSHVSLYFWKIIYILMFELLAYSTFKIFIKDIKDENKKISLTWILIFGIIALPLIALKDAGWIATTTNYLWVLALRCISFNFNKEKCKWRKNKMVL